MISDEKAAAHIRTVATGFRFAGWWFLVLGSLASVWPVSILFDPSAAMPVNGVPHKDFPTKLGVAVLVLIAPAIGALLALSPRRKLEAALETFDRFAHDFVSSRMPRK
jgi:hypothetical protein